MNNPAIFDVESICDGNGFFVIRDVGQGNELSVTNDAENVVAKVFRSGVLKPDQRLLYIDSEGDIDELKIKDGKFAGFAPGPNR